MLHVMMTLFLLLQAAARPYPSMSTGLEWMVMASFIVPAVLLAVLIYLGSRSAVRR